MRVVVRQANFDKVAHKWTMGDYQPEIVYETAGFVEVDPRDEAAIDGSMGPTPSNLSRCVMTWRCRDTAFGCLHQKSAASSDSFKGHLGRRKAKGGRWKFLDTLWCRPPHRLACSETESVDAILIQGEERQARHCA